MVQKNFNEMPRLNGHVPIVSKGFTQAETQEGDLIIEGYASKAIKDRVGDLVVPSAFQEAIKSYLDSPVLLYMHDKSKPIGAISELDLDNDGIKVKGFIAANSKFAKDEVIPLVERGILNSFSIGFIPKAGQFEPKSESYVITKGELLEISIVSVAANQGAKFSVVKEFEENENFEELRKEWKERALSSQKTEEKESMTAEELKQLQDQLDAAKREAAALKDKIAEKDQEVKNLSTKAEELDSIKESMHQKALEEEATRKAAEAEKMDSQMKEMKDLVESLKSQIEENTKDLEEAKAMASKGAVRIEFPDVPGEAIWKDYGSTLDNMFIVGSLLKKAPDEVVKLDGYTDLPEQVKSVSLAAEFRTLAGRRIWEDIRANATIASIFGDIELPTDIYNLPYDASSITAEWVTAGNTSADQTLTISPVQFQASKLMAKVRSNYEDEADALVPVVAQVRKNLVNAMADRLDETIMVSDATTGNYANTFRGLEDYASGASMETAATSATALAADDVYNAMLAMGKYAFKRNDTVALLNFAKYGQIVGDTNVTTVDKYGPSATIHTGELAKAYGKPIIVSDFVTGNNTATTGKSGILVYTPGFLLGYRTNMLVETDKNVETQQKIIVFTIRVDFKSIYPLSGGQIPATYPILQEITNP